MNRTSISGTLILASMLLLSGALSAQNGANRQLLPTYEKQHNIKIAECFDINSNNYENRDKIAEKIADAEIVTKEVQPSAQQPNIQEQSGNIIQNISQWCLQDCCCCLNK